MEQLVSFNKLTSFLRRNLQFLYNKLGQIKLTSGIIDNTGKIVRGVTTTINGQKYYGFYSNMFQLQSPIQIKSQTSQNDYDYIIKSFFYKNNIDDTIVSPNGVINIDDSLYKQDTGITLSPKFYNNVESNGKKDINYDQYYQRLYILCSCEKQSDFPGIIRVS